MSYGAKSWLVKVEDVKRLESTKMRMLRMTCYKTLKDRLNNERIPEMVGVEPISQFLQKQKVGWLGHLERMKPERGPVNARLFQVEGSKRGRPKKRWEEEIKKDLQMYGLNIEDA